MKSDGGGDKMVSYADEQFPFIWVVLGSKSQPGITFWLKYSITILTRQYQTVHFSSLAVYHNLQLKDRKMV